MPPPPKQLLTPAKPDCFPNMKLFKLGQIVFFSPKNQSQQKFNPFSEDEVFPLLESYFRKHSFPFGVKVRND